MTDEQRAALVERVTRAIATDQIRSVFAAAGLIGDDLQDAFISRRISVAAVAAIEPAIRADERALVAEKAMTDEAVERAALSDIRFDGRGNMNNISNADRKRYRERCRASIRAALGGDT